MLSMSLSCKGTFNLPSESKLITKSFSHYGEERE